MLCLALPAEGICGVSCAQSLPASPIRSVDLHYVFHLWNGHPRAPGERCGVVGWYVDGHEGFAVEGGGIAFMAGSGDCNCSCRFCLTDSSWNLCLFCCPVQQGTLTGWDGDLVSVA